MKLTQSDHNGILLLTAPNLTVPGLHHGFSTRPGGVSQPPCDSLNLGISRGDEAVCVRENYERFCAALGVSTAQVVFSQQTHTTNVRRVTAEDAGKGLLRKRDYTDIDALITNEPDLLLTVFSADCGIILLYDPVQRAIGALHAGWRGCAGGIAEKTVQEMARCFGTNSADLQAAIGPCIGQCCFETDADVPDAMRKALGTDAEPYLEWRDPKWHVDLAGLNRQWLLRAGVLPQNICTTDLCTACRPDLFWSHRKMGTARGSQVAAISMEHEL